MRVDIRRITPVIQAKLRLTSSTSESDEVDELSSSNNLEICAVYVTSTNIPDSEEGSLVNMTTPTIFPVRLKQKHQEHSQKLIKNEVKQFNN